MATNALIPNNSPNSQPTLLSANLRPPIIPAVSAAEVVVFGKKYRNWDLFLITTELILSKSCVSGNDWSNCCTGLEIVSSSTSPILAVPWIGRIPSDAKNNTSPPISIILSVAIHPILFVTSEAAKSDELDPVIFFILSFPKTYKASLNLAIPVISNPTLIVPDALADLNLLSVLGSLNNNLFGPILEEGNPP